MSEVHHIEIRCRDEFRFLSVHIGDCGGKSACSTGLRCPCRYDHARGETVAEHPEADVSQGRAGDGHAATPECLPAHRAGVGKQFPRRDCARCSAPGGILCTRSIMRPGAL